VSRSANSDAPPASESHRLGASAEAGESGVDLPICLRGAQRSDNDKAFHRSYNVEVGDERLHF
jgi:hypothetical protein